MKKRVFGFFVASLTTSAFSQVKLERPELQKKAHEQTYVSAEFAELLRLRPQQCSEFLNLLEGKLSGTVTPDSNVQLSKFNTYGILVAKKDGTVLFEKYYKDMQPDTRFKMFSISKLFSVLSFGAAEMRGLLNQETLLAPYIQKDIESYGIQYPYWNQLKIKHMLTMSSGIPWCEYGSCAARDAFSVSFAPHKQNALRYFFQNSTRAASQLQPLSPPGERYNYSLGGALVIQAVLRKILKAEYHNYPSDFIFNDLEVAPNEWTFDRDGTGMYMGGSGLMLNLSGMAKIGLTLMNDGNYNGHQIARPEFIKQMTQEILPTLRQSHDKIMKAWEGPTGMGLWNNMDSDPEIPPYMPDAPNNMFYGSGYNGRRLMMFPEDGEDGFLVARIGAENNHSYYWKPYSKKLYDCLGNHPELTPRNRGTIPRDPIPEIPPKITTDWQNWSAKISLIKNNLSLQMVATEFCNCAFVSNMAVRNNSGAISVPESIEKCTDVTQADFSALPSPLRPRLDPQHVFFSETGGVKKVTAVMSTILNARSYVAEAQFDPESGVCQLTKVPARTLVP